LRALKTKTAAKVTYNLIDIFCTFGAPSILQSDNGREFVNCIIDEIKNMWPQLKIVHGKPRHSQSQGSVERANRDVKDILRAWMSTINPINGVKVYDFASFEKIVAIILVLNNHHLRYYSAVKYNLASLLVLYLRIYSKH
jgi:hypothetical protein